MLRSMAHHDIDVAELAAWLAAEGRDALWSVDGEEVLASRLSVPCTAEDMADALRAHGGQVRVFDSREVSLPGGEPLTRANLGKVADVDEDAARAFQLAWMVGHTAGDPWMLVEDTLAKTASASARDHAQSLR
jgi:hypothetical protein